MSNGNRKHTTEEIRDHWLMNRGADGSDWEQAICAVYDLGAKSERDRIEMSVRSLFRTNPMLDKHFEIIEIINAPRPVEKNEVRHG